MEFLRFCWDFLHGKICAMTGENLEPKPAFKRQMTKAPLYSAICLAGIMQMAAYAQAPAPIEVPAPGATPGLPTPISPVMTPSEIAPPGVEPAPIEPPIQINPGDPAAPGATPGAPGLPGTSLPGTSPTDAPVAGSLSPNEARVFEFQGDEVGLVLRTLARQAGVNLIISDQVAAVGTIEARLTNKTPLQAIQIIVDTKQLILEERGGDYYILTQAEKKQEPTEPADYTFSYAQAADVMAILQSQLQSEFPPQIDTRTNTVFYRVSKSNADRVLAFLQKIDSPTQQVMIEARLVEVTANPRQSYGINWAGTVGSSGTAQTIRYGATTPATINPTNGAITALPQVTFNNGRAAVNDFVLETDIRSGEFLDALSGQFAIITAPSLSMTLRLLNEDSDAEFLACPRVVTANNQKAEIKITRAQPVPQLNFNEQTATSTFGGFIDKEFGNTLNVTPSINKDDFITLKVKPVISNKVGDATFILQGSTVTSPVIDTRSLDSNVLIKSGDTLAIGGLLQDEVGKGRVKVPVLGDIPILGYLFQERLNSRTKRNLLVFVTPTIIKQGYGTGLENQVSGLVNSGNEYADVNGWRNNAKGAWRLIPTSNRTVAADVPKPGNPKAPRALPARPTGRSASKKQ